MLRSKMSLPQPMPWCSVTLRVLCQVTMTRRSSQWRNVTSSGAPSRGSLERRRRNWQLGSDRWQPHATSQTSRIHWTRRCGPASSAPSTMKPSWSPCSVRRKRSWRLRKPWKSRRKLRKQPRQPRPRTTPSQMRSRWFIRRSRSETTITTTTRSHHHHQQNHQLAPLPGVTVVERTAMRWRTVVCLTQYATCVARKDTSKQPASPSRGHPRSTSSQRLPSTL